MITDSALNENSGQDQPDTVRGTHPAVAVLATCLVCLPILFVSQLIAHTRVDEFDTWLFAYYGRQMLAGKVLYAEVWDNKPPGIFWLNAVGLWVAGGSLAGPIAMCAAAVTAATGLFFVVARRLYGLAAACVSTLMAAIYLNQQYFHVGADRPSTFFTLTDLAAVFFYVRSFEPSRSPGRSMAFCGALAAVGLLFLQSAVAVTVVIVIHLILLALARRLTAGQAGRRLGAFAMGWLAVIVAAGLVLLVTSDAAWAWHAIVSFNRGYFAPGVGSRFIPQWFGLREQVEVLALPLILGVATLASAVGERFIKPSQRIEKSITGQCPAFWLTFLWMWMLMAAWLAAVGPHQRLHYFGVALPPLCMLAAHGVYLFLASGRTLDNRYPPFYLFIGVVWFGYMLISPLENQMRAAAIHTYSRFDQGPGPREKTAGFIRQVSHPGDTLFVWSYDPQVYWLADRPPAIRYIATEKAGQLGRAGQPILDEIIALLQKTPPDVLVLTPDEWLAISEPKPDAPLRYGNMATWIAAHYTRHPEAPRKNIWLRNKPE